MIPDKKTIYEYLVSNAADKMTQFLIEDYKISLEEALDRVYRSRTFELLQHPDNELYIQSPSYIRTSPE